MFKGLQALAGVQAPGTVSLVGAGPGDALLISVKGAIRLSHADVILYDGLLSEQLLEMKREGAEAIFVGKRRGHTKTSQDQINAILIEKARAGLRVVRLKSGDPFVPPASAAASLPAPAVSLSRRAAGQSRKILSNSRGT